MRTSTEQGGVGQSGYTAGRRHPDCALDRELVTRYATYPRGSDEQMLPNALGLDDRFTGRGGTTPLERECTLSHARTGA